MASEGADSPPTAKQNTLNMRNTANGLGALWGFLCLLRCVCVCDVSDKIRRQTARVAPLLLAKERRRRVFMHILNIADGRRVSGCAVIMKPACLCVWRTQCISRWASSACVSGGACLRRCIFERVSGNNSWRRASEMRWPSTGVLEFRQRGGAGINN